MKCNQKRVTSYFRPNPLLPIISSAARPFCPFYEKVQENVRQNGKRWPRVPSKHFKHTQFMNSCNKTCLCLHLVGSGSTISYTTIARQLALHDLRSNMCTRTITQWKCVQKTRDKWMQTRRRATSKQLKLIVSQQTPNIWCGYLLIITFVYYLFGLGFRWI